MAELNVNGISSQLDRSQQRDEKTYQQFNGVHSSQSSRSSSPSLRLGQISSSHLLVNRPIPQSQLPPSHFPPNTITQQMGGLNLRQTVSNISPKYGTSTPNVQSPENIRFPSVSPVARPKTNVSVTSVVPKLTQTPQESPGMDIRNTNSQQIRNVNNGPISESQTVNLTPSVSSHFGQQNVQPTIQQIIPPPIQQNIAPQRNVLHQQSVQPSLPSLPNIQSKPLYKQLSSQMPPTSAQTMPNQSYPPPYLMQNQQNVERLPQTSQNDLHKKTAGLAITQHNSPMNNFNTNIGLQPKLPMGNSMMPPSASMPPMSQPFQPPTYQSNTVNSFSGLPPPMSNVIPLVGNIPPTQKTSLFSNRYPSTQQQLGTPEFSPHQQQFVSTPQQQSQQQAANMIYQQSNYNNQQPQYNVTQSGFNKMWGHESYDLLQTPNILPPTKIEAPKVYLGSDILDQANCSPDIFHCTMTKIPENNSLLQKSRLPLGVLIHPFRDLSHLPVIQCNVIVRCRACRTYINPFVTFVDNKRWKCNLCYRINELPEEFQYDPVSKTYGDPSRRPEIKSSTLEYIAPAEYMLRPPQPAVYLYLLDVSRLAIESGYLQIVSNILLEELKNIPGDARTLIGFIAFDSAVHFYCLPDGITQPQEMTVLDIDEIFLPTPDNLLVNLRDRMELIIDLLSQLPNRFANTFNTNSALGAALQAAYKMMGATGGRVTVFQASLPNIGPGALTAREDPAQRTSVEVAQLNPINDFYKRLALECSGQQIAVDIFIVNSQYVDIATLSGISRFSGGCIHHFPLLRPTKPLLCEEFARSFRRYLTRKIGFEAVMRIRCTRGLSIHTFHGNFFVRSTDLLSLPNINPDAGFGMQVAIEESLSDVQSVCFQAALLYTSSKGERRIRVHTICLPVASTLHDIIHSADQQCIVGLLSKMAVDRSMQSSLSDAREAFINVAIDILSSYKLSLNLGSPNSGLLAPNCLRLLPLYISALLKHPAFRVGSATKIDDRVMAMINMKTKPLYLLMQQIYPDLYPIHDLESQQVILNTEEEPVPMPPRIQLTARCLENKGVFLMDMGEHMLILVCPNAPLEFLNEALGVANYNAVPDEMYDIPILDNPRNQRLHQFINYLNEDKPYVATVQIIRDNSSSRLLFFEKLIEDRVENALSYHEFLQHLKTQVK